MSSSTMNPSLSRRERSLRTAELFEEISRGERDVLEPLIEELVLVNRGVAEAVARRYRGRGIASDDLEQVALEGLVKAVRRFDPSLRNDFLSYAVPTIRGEVQRYFRDRGWAVRPPRRVQEIQSKVSQTLDGLTQELGHEPSQAELLTSLGIDRAAYAEAMSAQGCFQPTSLDQPLLHDTEDTIGTVLVGQSDVDVEARLLLTPVLRRLPERDRRILYMRFYEDRTQAEIGQELGVTQMQVSRLLNRILIGMRRDLGDDD